MSVLREDPFWFNDYTILYEKTRLTEFFPSKEMRLNEKLNAILRLSIYASLVLFVVHKTLNMLFAPCPLGENAFGTSIMQS